jgi:hypothetical protein
MKRVLRHCLAVSACVALLGACLPAQGAMTIGANFWNISWEGTSDYYQGGVNWTTTTNPWNPTFLTDCAPYTVLRFMDWCLPLQGSNNGIWAQRTQKTATQDMSGNRAVAYEWMIDLCNRLNKDMWICVPTLADTNYSYQLAVLTNSLLNSNLKVWVEYTNEHWNYDAAWYQTQGANMGMPGTDATTRGDQYYVYRSVQVWEQFEKVFGKNSPRIVKFLGSFAANVSVSGHMFAALADTVHVNPHKVKADAMGIAPYIRGADVAASRAELPSKGAEVRGHKNLCTRGGVLLACYEMGFETSTGSVIAADPAVYQLYKDYFDTLMAAGVNGPANQYTAVGGTSGYQWGAKATTGQSSSTAHKYRAIVDWMAAHPPTAVAPGGVQQAAVAARPQVVQTAGRVEVQLGATQVGTAQLLRMNGIVLQSRSLSAGSSTLPTAGYAAGCYLLRTQVGAQSQAQMVVIK